MVFFVCGACGDSFKRKQAEQHTLRCKNWSFSCMDCNKVFPGRSFVEHKQCLSESEKYFGDHHVPKVGSDKNEIWMNKIREGLTCHSPIKPYINNLLQKILQYPNIPRKALKFENFLKTSLKLSHKPTIDELWNIISKAAESTVTSSLGAELSTNLVESNNVVELSGSPNDSSIPEKLKIKHDVESDHLSCSEDHTIMRKSSKRKVCETENNNDLSGEESLEPLITVSKSAKRRKRKQHQSATEEPDYLFSPEPNVKNSLSVRQETENDLGDLGDIGITTINATKNFKWRRIMKKIIREHSSAGIKVKKLLNKIETLHNDPLTGAAQPLARDVLEVILMKMLARKPFRVTNGRAFLGCSG